MATDFRLFDAWARSIGDGTTNMANANSFKYVACLMNSTTTITNSNSVFSDIGNIYMPTNMIANTISLGGIAWWRIGNTVTWSSNAFTFTANNGFMVADKVVIVEDANADGASPPADTDKLVGWANIDSQNIANAGSLTIRSASNNSQCIFFVASAI